VNITSCASALLLALPAGLHSQSADTTKKAAPGDSVTVAAASPDTAVKITFGGFIDGYYAYDFNRPPSIDRSYTTQPARHNEFNINLAHVEAKVEGGRVHGRLALQAGTSVQSNYAGEPTIGTVSGSSLSRHIQEAFAGYKVADKLWIDGGIFFSHIGNETWISRDNWTYSRSLVADFTPYYETGVRATWQATPVLTVTGVVVNGWQNISETNSDKAVGIRLDYAISPTVTVSYDNFFGNEQPDSVRSRLRIFNEALVKAQITGAFGVELTADYGMQRRASGDGNDAFYIGAVVARYALNPKVALNGRAEYFSDRHGVLTSVPAGADGFRTGGASVGVDVIPQPRLLWRTELRGFSARDHVFPNRSASDPFSRHDGFVVTSLALTI
jgi:Putative beta-barrel porin-2, OmpL-like. bbp2